MKCYICEKSGIQPADFADHMKNHEVAVGKKDNRTAGIPRADELEPVSEEVIATMGEQFDEARESNAAWLVQMRIELNELKRRVTAIEVVLANYLGRDDDS